jgi:hypothetical protein
LDHIVNNVSGSKGKSMVELWKPMPPTLKPHVDGAACCWKDRIYVFGGCDDLQRYNNRLANNSIECYDPNATAATNNDSHDDIKAKKKGKGNERKRSSSTSITSSSPSSPSTTTSKKDKRDSKENSNGDNGVWRLLDCSLHPARSQHFAVPLHDGIVILGNHITPVIDLPL